MSAIDVASGKYGKLIDKLDEANRSGTHRGRKRVSASNASEFGYLFIFFFNLSILLLHLIVVLVFRC